MSAAQKIEPVFASAHKQRRTRPQTRADCLPGGCNEERPCPWVSCPFHLFLDVCRTTGEVQQARAFEGLSVWELEHTCCLDMADLGGATLAEVGEAYRVTRERIRQLQAKAMPRLLRALKNEGLTSEGGALADIKVRRQRRGARPLLLVPKKEETMPEGMDVVERFKRVQRLERELGRLEEEVEDRKRELAAQRRILAAEPTVRGLVEFVGAIPTPEPVQYEANGPSQRVVIARLFRNNPEKRFRRQDITELTGVSERQVSSYLSLLKRHGAVERLGDGWWRRATDAPEDGDE